MAAVELLAAGASEASTADQVLTDGASLVLAVKAADDRALAIVELKDDAGNYWPIVNLTRQDPAFLVTGPATYRVRRIAAGSCGVYSG